MKLPELNETEINELNEFVTNCLTNKEYGLVIIEGNYETRRAIFKQFALAYEDSGLFHFSISVFRVESWEKPRSYVSFINMEEIVENNGTIRRDKYTQVLRLYPNNV